MNTESGSIIPLHVIRKSCFSIMKFVRTDVAQRLQQIDVDLQPHHMFVLFTIMRKRSLTLRELSHELELDPSTLAPNVEMLVRKGLLKRNRDPLDRRRVPLTLTPAGNELCYAMKALEEQGILARGLKQMGEDKSQQLVNLLQEYVAFLMTLASETSEASKDSEGSKHCRH